MVGLRKILITHHFSLITSQFGGEFCAAMTRVPLSAYGGDSLVIGVRLACRLSPAAPLVDILTYHHYLRGAARRQALRLGGVTIYPCARRVFSLGR